MPFVLSSTKKPLMPCTPKRARLLLERGKAAVFRIYPFTIILKEREDGETQPVEFKVDPGSKTTGLAVVAQGKTGKKVVAGSNIQHRGQAIKKRLEQRRGVRRSRRNRHVRHRKPRFQNRCRKACWLPPSLMSRVHNVETWAKRIQKLCPISTCTVETVRFDMQKMQNPEVTGVEYQQGELLGYEVREYLLEKWERKCAYCGKENVPLEVEHIQPKSKGGTNRVSNLTLACHECNEKKGSQDIRDFLKDHWIDAACVRETGEKIVLPKLKVRCIIATGHGDRQLCLVNKHGFPRSKAASSRIVNGFKTGDLVEAKVTAGKKTGIYRGKVAVRTSGNFNVSTKSGVVQGISHRFCRKLHGADGYSY